MDWARAIRDYRSINRLTQEEFAAQIGVEPRSLRRWETGDSVPARYKSRQLAELLSPFAPIMEIIADLVRLSSGNAVMMATDSIVLSISPAAQADLLRCGVVAEIGQECRCVPDDILEDQLAYICDESVSRFTSEYIAHWPGVSEHVRSDVRVFRMFTVPILIDHYRTDAVSSTSHMAHLLRAV